MPLLKRLATLLVLTIALGLAGCSSLTLAYNQLPRLGSWWLDSYLDLDSAQHSRLKEALQAWQAWHRREELPQLQALLRQAHATLDDGVMTRDELLALEQGARASLERCLQHAAPLAAPVLADLRPEQWRHLQRTMDEKAAEWRDQMGGPDGATERAKRYTTSLERWLGDLDRATRRQARADAQSWPFDLAAQSQAQSARRAGTLQALRAWSAHDLATGTATVMRLAQPLPAEQAYREESMAGLLRLLNGMTARQREQVRAHWAGWQTDLQALQGG